MLPLNSLSKRNFARNVRGLHFDSSSIPENPFKITSDYLFKINRWLLEKVPTMDPISHCGNVAHDYEVYLQDECSNPKFDLKPRASREPYKGHYDLEGMQTYLERGAGVIHQDNFKHFIGKEELKVSKMAYGT